MHKEAAYIKHIYWVTGAQAAQLKQDLGARGVRMRAAKGVVCTPMDGINKISCVAPDVWNETCARQGSWYRASEKRGLYLVVSAFALSGYEDRKAATVTPSGFKPPRTAGMEEKRAMAGDKDVVPHIPPEWPTISETERRILLRWARRLGSDIEDDDSLYVSHTANHANFIKPVFFIKEKETLVPYSIDRSAHLCSACLEVFQVVGDDHPVKLVAPCPGMTIFARLRPDRYLRVEKG